MFLTLNVFREVDIDVELTLCYPSCSDILIGSQFSHKSAKRTKITESDEERDTAVYTYVSRRGASMRTCNTWH